MRKIFLACLIISLFSNIFATKDEIELFREKGYQAKLRGDYITAIEAYQTILELNSADYDAKLALGRLNILQKDLISAREYFRQILAQDETDLEAYLGLAQCAELVRDFSQQITYLNKIIKYAPENISEQFLVKRLFELAVAYQYHQQYRTASKTYDEILKIDATYAEAWAEKAKLAFWSNRPYQAKRFYQTATKWDPNHLPYQEGLSKMIDLSRLNFTTKQNYLQETEAGLQTKNYEQIYQVSKRLNDFWESELAYHSIYSHRNRSGYKTAILADFIKLKNRFYWRSDHYLEGSWGYSLIDGKFLNYQLHLSNYFYFASLKIYNHFSFNNELFEYWNEVSRKYLHENIRISAYDFELILDYNFGWVDRNFIGSQDQLGINDFMKYSLSLKREFRRNLQLGINYQFQDFASESVLYYTPINKKLFGLDASYYWEYQNIYNYLSTNLQIDNYQNLEQSYTLEFGYNFSSFSASISYSRFENIYYQSDAITCLLRGKF